MAEVKIDVIKQIAPDTAYKSGDVVQREYGRLLEDFNEGDVFLHPRGFTVDRTFAQEYAAVFHDANPLFLSEAYAKAHGFADLPVHPMQVFNIVLSLGVQNNSEKAMANLGYYDVEFKRVVYPGDTITARSKVLGRRERGEGKPGIVHVRTLGLNQRDEIVIQYERKIMVPPRGSKAEGMQGDPSAPFPEEAGGTLYLPDFKMPSSMDSYTGTGTRFGDFTPGRVFVHKNMRTITDEHVPWTYRMGNTHPLHYDRIYSTSLSGAMSGEPIVYGGLVFAWLIGLASRDTTENMLWDLGYTEGYHTQPAISGDTVGALSRVLSVEDGPVDGTGIVQLQFIGVKNISTKDALDKFGEDLFIKEGDKKGLGKDKLKEKIFEIERRILVKK